MTAIEIWSINFKRFIDFIPNYFSTSPMDVSFELQTTTGSSVRTFPNLIKQIGLNGVVNGGTYNVSTWQEAATLLESFSNKRILGNVVVQLPSGTLDAYDSPVNLVNTGGIGTGRITLRGAGKDTTTIQKAPNQWAMMYLQNANLYLEDLTIDEKSETTRSLRVVYNSTLIVVDNSVKIKNSNAAYAIELVDSILNAITLTLENCNGGISIYRSKAYLDYFNFISSTTATGTALKVERNSYLSTNNSKIVNNGALSYGIYARNMCFVSAYMAEISANVGIYASGTCVIEASNLILNSEVHGITLYDKCRLLGGYYTKSTLDAAAGISHYRLDADCYVYTKENTLVNGKQIANIYHGSLFRFYNSTNLINVSDGINNNRINIYQMSVVERAGSTTTCNVADNTTTHPDGTNI